MFRKILVPLLLISAPAQADMTDEANACIDELMSRYGNVGGEVIGQQSSEAGTMVQLRDGNGVDYECVVWSGPVVADLRPAGSGETGADDGGGALDGASGSSSIVSGDQRVQFAAGTSSINLNAVLDPETTVRYLLGAGDGQFLDVNVASRGGALDYRILNPDGSALLDLTSSDTPYRGQLWQSGDHVVEIMNAGAQPVTFDLRIGID